MKEQKEKRKKREGRKGEGEREGVRKEGEKEKKKETIKGKKENNTKSLLLFLIKLLELSPPHWKPDRKLCPPRSVFNSHLLLLEVCVSICHMSPLSWAFLCP